MKNYEKRKNAQKRIKDIKKVRKQISNNLRVNMPQWSENTN